METPMSTIIQTGDLGGQKVQMRIDENALAHIMSVLTDLYSDPQAAVIREYSTNARDSHIEAGNTAPIEIYTPSSLSPYFKIKDYGVGLSVDDIVDMYSKYGASTKRGTNDQVGMLGLGAKSALTLVPQFTITSVKNGVRILVSVSRSADGSGQMEIIDTKATDEPNGVEISIPLRSNYTFTDKVNSFFRFWEPGTVLVDGKEPARIQGRKVGDRMVIDSSLAQDYVVMGGVAYPVKDGLYTDRYRKLGIVAFVNIGDVNFTPSREDLQYTPQTRATIVALQREFKDKVLAAAQEEINAAADHVEAWIKAEEWRKTFRSMSNPLALTYKGQDIPRSIPLEGRWRTIDTFARSGRSWNYVYEYSVLTRGRYLFITGFAKELKISPTQREKIRVYLANKNLSFTNVAITDGTDFPHNDWTKDAHVVDWATIAAIKISRAARATTVRTDPYDLYVGTWQTKSVSALDTTKDIIYISPAENKRPDFLRTAYPDAQIVMLATNRWDKFRRDWPTAMHYKDKIAATKSDLAKKFTEADKILWHHWSNYRYTCAMLDADSLDDPDLKSFVKIIQGGLKFSSAAEQARSLRGNVGEVEVDVPTNPLTKYPLAGNISRTDTEHAHWYLNSFYNTVLKEQK